MQEKRLVDLFFRQRNIFYEAIFFVFLGFTFFFIVIYQDPSLFSEKIFGKKNQINSAEENVKKVLVKIKKNENDQDFRQKSKIISTENQKGRGRIARGHEQHLLGSTRLRSSNKFYVSPNRKWDLQDFRSQKNVVEKKNFSLDSYKKKPTKKVFSVSMSKNLSVETENSLSPKFWFNEDSLLSVAVEKEKIADFFLPLSQKLVERFALYINSAGAINYHFLRRDSVSSLIKIDRHGQVHLVDIVSRAQYQPYLDYVVERVFDENIPLKIPLSEELFKELSKLANGTEVHLVLVFFYTGPPLYKWWIVFENFDEK